MHSLHHYRGSGRGKAIHLVILSQHGDSVENITTDAARLLVPSENSMWTMAHARSDRGTSTRGLRAFRASSKAFACRIEVCAGRTKRADRRKSNLVADDFLLHDSRDRSDSDNREDSTGVAGSHMDFKR